MRRKHATDALTRSRAFEERVHRGQRIAHLHRGERLHRMDVTEVEADSKHLDRALANLAAESRDTTSLEATAPDHVLGSEGLALPEPIAGCSLHDLDPSHY
jgi:hypothetical protein